VTITISEGDYGVLFATSEDLPNLFIAALSREHLDAALNRVLNGRDDFVVIEP
jgi:hypothetical protein